MIRSTRNIATALATVLLIPAVTAAQASPGADGPYLIRGGTVVTGTGERLPNTSILVRNGRIAQIGPNITANDAKVIEAKDKFV
ncbi:MAG TPA: hypothetical protein VH559_11900, partial [Gemmatimonadaceae bacterium]